MCSMEQARRVMGDENNTEEKRGVGAMQGEAREKRRNEELETCQCSAFPWMDGMPRDGLEKMEGTNVDRACFSKFKANGSGEENTTHCLAFLSSHPTGRCRTVIVVSTPTEELGTDGTSKIEAVRNRDAWIAWHDVGRRPWVGPSFMNTVIPIHGKGGYTIPFFPLTRGAFTCRSDLGDDGPNGETLSECCMVKVSQKR